MTHLEIDHGFVIATEPAGVISRRRGEVQIDEWVAPQVCDAHGFASPGTALEWLNAVGVMAASRFARAPASTVAIDGVRVRRRIATGDRIALRARVVHTSARSIGVSVAIDAPHGGAVVDAYLTFVVVGDDGRARGVPRFDPRSIDELAGHHEGEARARFRGDVVADTRLRGDVRLTVARASFAHISACAATAAEAFLDAPPRLLGVDGLAFLRPRPLGAVVRLDASAVHSDDLGVTVMVTGSSEHPQAAASAPSLRGFFTYTPIDATRAVPRLARLGRDESLFCEVMMRHRLREALTDLRSQP